MMHKIFVFLLTCLFITNVQANPLGVWLTQNKKSEIKISKCGDKICGTIVKSEVKGAKDVNNKDTALRGRAILGMQMFTLDATSNPKKYKGELYNARNGKIYKGQLLMLGERQLKVEGCVLFICQGEVWTKK